MKKLVLLVLLLTAGIAQAQESVKPTQTVAAYIMSWEMQNDACKGGDQQACRFRDAILLEIESQGWCLSDTQKWQPAPCDPTPLSDTIFRAKEKLPASLQKDWSDFAARFTTALPVTETEDGWIVGKGCMTGSCDTDAAAWALNKDSHAFGALMKKNGKFFYFYGSKDFPLPLAVWGLENGM
jgi:hypothetical protein